MRKKLTLVDWPEASSDRIKSVYASVVCVYCFFFVCLYHLSIFRSCSWRCRMEEERGGRLSYSGKWTLKQLSKHCQQCSWACCCVFCLRLQTGGSGSCTVSLLWLFTIPADVPQPGHFFILSLLCLIRAHLVHICNYFLMTTQLIL